jgi:hypothetical protein
MMGQMSQEQINVDLFGEIKRLKQENELLNAEKELLQAKWEAQGLMIQKLHKENKRYKTALKEIERWDKMLYSSRELGNFAKKALGLPTIPLED